MTTTKAAHTPGPKSDRELLGDELSDGIHEVGQYLMGGRLDPLMAHRLRTGYKLLMEARSKLAAAARAHEVAAPDLLALAKRWLERLEYMEGVGELNRGGPTTSDLDEARAAISRAEGRT